MAMGMRSVNLYVVAHSNSEQKTGRLFSPGRTNRFISEVSRANKYDVSFMAPHEQAEAVVKVLAEYIGDEDLKPGDILPPEGEFRKIIGVRTRVLREALFCLKGMGLVQSCPGKGWQVESFDPSVGLHFLFPILKRFSGLDIDHIMQIRLTTEPLMARLAAQNISVYGLTILDLSLGLMKEAGADGDLQKFQDQDKRFHAILAQECGNAFLPILGSLLVGFYYLLQENPMAHYEVEITQHQEIFRAIKARNSENAEKAMAAHIQKSWDYLNAKKKEWISR